MADGEHLFEYQVDNKFLKHFETALVQEANIAVQLSMLKFMNSLELNFKINGSVLVPCDVCIEEFDLEIVGQERIAMKIVNEIPPNNDEYNIIYLEESSSSVNIAEMLYELIMLSIPMKKVHPLDENGQATCDASILQYLENSGETIKRDKRETENNISPVWDELKKLK